jgi:hypothetical protein
MVRGAVLGLWETDTCAAAQLGAAQQRMAVKVVELFSVEPFSAFEITIENKTHTALMLFCSCC